MPSTSSARALRRSFATHAAVRCSSSGSSAARASTSPEPPQSGHSVVFALTLLVPVVAYLQVVLGSVLLGDWLDRSVDDRNGTRLVLYRLVCLRLIGHKDG